MKFKKQLKTTSFISESCEFSGNLYSKNGIRIDGKVCGILNCDSTVYVGEKARIEADIFTVSLVSGGKIKGNVNAGDTVRINRPGSIKGNIHTCDLIIENKVNFEGNCRLRSYKDNKHSAVAKPKLPRKPIPNR